MISLGLLVGGLAPRVTPAGAAPTPRGSWPQWTNPTSKIVPIVSAGTPGVRLGIAQVRGPKRQVDRVRAVLQIDGDFKSVRAKILVPSDSLTDLRRVQGTAVSGVAQYRLVTFGSSKKDAPPPPEESCCPKHNHGKHKGWKKHHGHRDECR